MSKITPFTACVIALSLGVSVPLVVSAQNRALSGRPPAPDTAGMADKLNVSEDVLKACMPRPKKGQRPEKPDAGKLTGCLKADNAYVSKNDVEQVLEAYAPKPPVKG
ncbi:hypothetical protein KO498_10180 [Lentibacter algarum]|uniref:hypothetical protein n=1 Tax=Lentibacter algarum TaxID=576131 RepID=UPI001C06946E|nr:hypothetical protein [Lentibacter algarum]MBU2982176.1 hypothetical protein [Lentibacter algarum]